VGSRLCPDALATLAALSASKIAIEKLWTSLFEFRFIY
jgi:hypothetical protein